MTDEGNHGGDTNEEIRTVLFSYTKGGFPMKGASIEVRSVLDKLKSKVKQHDLASIITATLDIPIPFSSVGVLYPYFF
jgi:hypothetical protein